MLAGITLLYDLKGAVMWTFHPCLPALCGQVCGPWFLTRTENLLPSNYLDTDSRLLACAEFSSPGLPERVNLGSERSNS